MKLILNKCFGWGNFSYQATMLYFKKKGMKVFPYATMARYDKGIEPTYEKVVYIPDNDFLGNKKEEGYIFSPIFYFKEEVDINSEKNIFDIEDKFGNNTLIDISFEKLREDQIMAEVVEELGYDANGQSAKLVVIEIPDGIKYLIEEYDGIEACYRADGLLG